MLHDAEAESFVSNGNAPQSWQRGELNQALCRPLVARPAQR